MAINKFVDRQGNTILDLSTDSISPNKVLTGTTYHGPDGEQHIGTLDPGPLDYSQYNFIDYDGTLLYSYTDEELDALEALPEGPNHTDDNLTFQEWNWSLADLKNYDKTRPGRPLVGAHYITTDGKSYLYMDTPYTGATLGFLVSGTLNSVDWGDGTVEMSTSNSLSHVYATPGQYVIVIDIAEGGNFYFDSNQASTLTNKQWIKGIKLGNVTRIQSNHVYSLQYISIPNSLTSIADYCFQNCYSLQYISIPNNVTIIPGYCFQNCYSLQYISIPNSVTSIGSYCFQSCCSFKNISIPNSVTIIPTNIFYNCYSLQNISIPNSVINIDSYAFRSCYSLKNISIPNSVKSIGSSVFSNCNTLTLDLREQTKVINLSGSPSLVTSYNKILVPNTLLTDYKSASNWSSYANIIVGV